MWIRRDIYEMLVKENERKTDEIVQRGHQAAVYQAQVIECRAQKAKDDITIDWMRHRINALEKERTILIQKAAGVSLPTPEIVPTRPGTMTVPDFSHMAVDFEDMGDDRAAAAGLKHNDLGFLEFKEDMKAQPAATQVS